MLKVAQLLHSEVNHLIDNDAILGDNNYAAEMEYGAPFSDYI